MIDFTPLPVSAVDTLTDDAVAITFDISGHEDLFAYEAGQHVTVRAIIDGEDVRRSYSICADAATGTLRVGIRRIDGGVFSTWATKEVQVGDILDVMAPVGDFTIEPGRGPRHLAAIAAGSGITPILSMISTVLNAEPHTRFTLVFGNRTSQSIMFLEELEGLKDQFTTRFNLIHVLSREPSSVPLFAGRIDAAKVEQLMATLITEPVDDWYLCGPYEMVQDATRVINDRQAGRVHDELFFSEPFIAPPPAPIDTEGFASVTFFLDGRASVVAVDPAGAPILDHALSVRSELPFSCRGGVCATCKAKVVEGEVSMDENWCLVPEELEAGLILTCQSHPVSDAVTIDFDV